MAEVGKSKIKHYRSSTPGAVPSAANMEDGEISLNTADTKIFMKSAAGVVTGANIAPIDPHIASTDNPHGVTKTQVSLGNVTNDTQLKIASNLSDVANAAASRTNLGLGTIATQAANNVVITGGTASVSTVATTSTTDATSTTAAPLKSAGGLAVAKKAYFGGAIEAVGGHIKFPVTRIVSADANTLDDYREGTFTPAITFATAGDLSVTYSSQVGTYTRIGNLVTAIFKITTSSFTHTTASGVMRIAGLPFNAVVDQQAATVGAIQGVTKPNYTQFGFYTSVNNVSLNSSACGSGQPFANILAVDMPSGGTVILWGQITYTTS